MPGRANIDWDAAFAYYAALGPSRRFGWVADRFGVSDTAVRKHAARERWAERVAALDEEAARTAERKALRSLEERQLRTIKAVEKTRDFLLSDDAPEPKWSDLAPLVKLELLIGGEATERIDVGTAKEMLAVALRFVPEERLDEAAGELRRIEEARRLHVVRSETAQSES
jgi:hypothetical protein